MKISNVLILVLLSFISLGQKNPNVLYSNIFYTNGSGALIPKYPSDDSNRSYRQQNINKVNLDSTYLYFEKCINEFRKDYGLKPLIFDLDLSAAAGFQGWYIVRSNNVSHYNDTYGATPLDRAKYCNINNFNYIGEVCLMDQRYMLEYPNYKSVNLEYTRTIFDLYWSSPHHREILQDPKYKKYGFFNYYNQNTKKFYNVIVVTD